MKEDLKNKFNWNCNVFEITDEDYYLEVYVTDDIRKL